MRGHLPFVIDDFQGWYSRGNPDSCPINHSILCINATFNQSSISSRKLWTRYSTTASKAGIRRMFIYNNNLTSNGKSFLIYCTNSGLIGYQQIFPTVMGPVDLIQLGNDTDIDVATFGGRAYIAISTLAGYYGVAVYVFDGTNFRPAGGQPPISTCIVGQGPGGLIDLGSHYYGVSYETDTGFITKPTIITPSPTVIAAGNQTIGFSPLPIGPAGTVARRIIGTKAIAGTGLPTDGLAVYPSYFIPGGRVADNTTTTLSPVSYTDSQLLDDASYLQNIYQNPPGGSCITVYHNRVVLGAISTGANQMHQIAVSRVNDPETFERANGVLVIDPSSDVLVQAQNNETLMTGITEVQEYRDTLYAWKLTSTYGIVDNGLEPSTWPIACLDQGMGAFRSGVITILDSGGISVEYLMVANKAGLFSFSGLYNYPEISWKIKNFWNSLVGFPKEITNPTINNVGKFNFVSDPINKILYALVGTNDTFDIEPTQIIYCDFTDTSIQDSNYYMNVKWSRWHHDASFGDSTGIIPAGLVGYDVGEGVVILTAHHTSGLLCEYGGLGSVVEVPGSQFCTITSSLIRDNEEAKVIHIGGYTLRAMGNGLTDVPIYSYLTEPYDKHQSTVRFVNLAQLMVTAANPKDKTVLANFLAQQTFLYLKAKEMSIDRLQIWIKPTYKTIPG